MPKAIDSAVYDYRPAEVQTVAFLPEYSMLRTECSQPWRVLPEKNQVVRVVPGDHSTMISCEKNRVKLVDKMRKDILGALSDIEEKYSEFCE